MGKKHEIGTVSAALVRIAMASDLTWDESVAAMGLACKALSIAAAKEGDGTPESCLALARKRFDEAFFQDVRVDSVIHTSTTH